MHDKPSGYLNMKIYSSQLSNWWGVKKTAEEYVLDSDDFLDLYDAIIHDSGISKLSSKYFDKTPIYMKSIGKCLCRAEFIEKAVIITRDPRSIFYSWAKRANKLTGKPIEKIVTDNLTNYSKRYIRYFIGAISECDNPKVMVIPFEGLCLSPSLYYKAVGHFVEGVAFNEMRKKPKYENVTSSSLDTSKVNEYVGQLSVDLQQEILNQCSIAAPFFGSNNETLKYFDTFNDINSKIFERLRKYSLKAMTSNIEGKLFNPWTYLYLNRDVLDNGVSPLTHFVNRGLSEGRKF
jgi:hypothetical protein